jgi:twitching motility two-component system response regulator PilH
MHRDNVSTETSMPIQRILVVDDSPVERHLLTELLIGQGYKVTIATDGAQGVETAKRDQPDLVLMDVVMPGINGFQATRSLSRDATTRHIPVILCTSKSEETDKIWGMRQGAQDYVTKPIDASQLLAKIAALG